MKTHTNEYWVPELNFLPEVLEGLHFPEHVDFYDVTLREIDQTPGAVLRTDEKVSMAKELDLLGVDYIEIFPMVHPDDAAALKEITAMPKKRKLKTSGLAICAAHSIDAVAATGCRHVMLEGPASMVLAPLYKCDTVDDLVKMYVDATKYAKSLGMTVACEPWDCGKSDLDTMKRIYLGMAEAGIDELIWADTFNNCAPWTVFYMIRKMKEWLGDSVKIGVHFHDDFGIATANAMAGVAAGATIVHTAMNNAGERNGNISLEEMSVALKLLMGIDTGIDLKRLYPVAKKLESISKLRIAPEKPIVGRRTFMTGSGLNMEQFFASKSQYDVVKFMPFHPSMVGQPDLEICWGKGCGSNMVAIHARNELGIELDKDQAGKVRDKIKSESMIRKDVIPVQEVNQYIHDISAGKDLD